MMDVSLVMTTVGTGRPLLFGTITFLRFMTFPYSETTIKLQDLEREILVCHTFHVTNLPYYYRY